MGNEVVQNFASKSQISINKQLSEQNRHELERQPEVEADLKASQDVVPTSSSSSSSNDSLFGDHVESKTSQLKSPNGDLKMQLKASGPVRQSSMLFTLKNESETPYIRNKSWAMIIRVYKIIHINK